MKESIQKWHNDTLAMHSAIMFETLIYTHNIISESVTAFTFEDEEGTETPALRGYLALKEVKGKKVKYFIDEKFYDHMPIRVNDMEELYLRVSSTKKPVINRVLDPTPFKILPEKTFDTTRQMMDELAPFEHSCPDEWMLLKIAAIMGYVGKTFLGICSPAEFGKSSIYEILHSITKKNPVFQPRSVPGVLIQITGDGNIIFDEVHKSNSETRNCMENFTLQVAGNKPIYINGAIKSANTKSKYDVSQQSITFLYNIYSYYSSPEEDFFDNFFANNGAVDSRLLKIKVNGKLLENFKKDFDLMKTAEENKMYYIKVAKHLLYLKKIKLENSYKRKYNYSSGIRLKGRKKLIYDEITWLIDSYCKDKLEYKNYITLFDRCINDYREMIGELPIGLDEVKEEQVE